MISGIPRYRLLGVKTIGNVTLIAYDEVPILATDPWLGDDDDAYFGNWRLSYKIPRAEKKEILEATRPGRIGMLHPYRHTAKDSTKVRLRLSNYSRVP